MSSCIACGNPQTRPYYNPGNQPLAALNLPRTREEALRSLRYPMNFHACLRCGHIFNTEFDVAQVPYSEDSNLMYNAGSLWDKHLNSVVAILRDDCQAYGETVLDIGAGDGLLLDKLNRASEGTTRCIAFEPGVEAETCRKAGLETYADYFIPDRDLERYEPDVLVCRHVLEHLQNPREFISDIARRTCQLDQSPILFAEVPCIEKGLRQGRVGDFLYEHVSNYTERSFCMMAESCGWYTIGSRLAYNDEVLIWLGEPVTCGYREPPDAFDWENTRELLQYIAATRQSVVFWGGTGKSAAFLNACELPPTCRVVDSDVRKAGRYVPGTGQLIEAANSLVTHPAKTVVITTRWRAADIYAEIKRDYPTVEEILYVDGNCIREYCEEEYVKETS